MKLIKLVSDQNVTKSEFVNNFSIPLTLKEDAQVALKSLSIEFESPIFVVDSTNNTFIFRTIAKGVDHIVQIPNGEYQIDDLVRMINARMNNILDIKSDETNKKKRDYGFQWTVKKELSIRNDLKLVFYFNRLASEAMNGSNTQQTGMTFTAGAFTKNVADDGTYNANTHLIPYVNQGGFEIALSLTQPTGTIGTANWILGCDTQSESLSDKTKVDITSKLLFGMSNQNGNYAVLKNGSWVEQTALPIATNDAIKIHKREGKIIYNVTKGTEETVIEGDIINDFEKTKFLGANLNSFNIFVGDNGANISFGSITVTPNPRVKKTNDIYEIVEPTKEYIYCDLGAPSDVTFSLVSIEFPTIGVQKLLGFLSKKLEENAKDAYFESQIGLQLNFFGGDDLLVEICEMSSINTYCQDFKQMRNIICSIPIADLRNAISIEGGAYILSYSETSNSLFIDLQNKFPLRIPTMTVRVLTSKGKLLDCNGKMSALILHQ